MSEQYTQKSFDVLRRRMTAEVTIADVRAAFQPQFATRDAIEHAIQPRLSEDMQTSLWEEMFYSRVPTGAQRTLNLIHNLDIENLLRVKPDLLTKMAAHPDAIVTPDAKHWIIEGVDPVAIVKHSMDRRYREGFVVGVNSALASYFIPRVYRPGLINAFDSMYHSHLKWDWLNRLPDFSYIKDDGAAIALIGRVLGFTIDKAKAEMPLNHDQAMEHYRHTSLYGQFHGFGKKEDSAYHNDTSIQSTKYATPSGFCPYESFTYKLMVGIGELIAENADHIQTLKMRHEKW